MASTSKTTVNIDKAKLKKIADDAKDATAHRAAEKVQQQVVRNIVAAGRVRTGHLRDSISIRKMYGGVYDVYTDVPYADFQEQGIGPVHAGHGKVLRFQPKGSSAFIFRPRTRGFPGAHFFHDAYRRITQRDFLP